MKFFKIDKSESEKIGILYEKYKNVMYKHAQYILKDSKLAEDAVHQSFIKIANNLSKINIDDDISTKNFLIIICKNTAKDMYNKNTKYINNVTYFETKDNKDIEDLFASIDAIDPCNIVIAREVISKVLDYISTLPATCRDMIILEKIYGYSQKEIGELLNISYSAIRKRSERARIKLKELLKREV